METSPKWYFSSIGAKMMMMGLVLAAIIGCFDVVMSFGDGSHSREGIHDTGRHVIPSITIHP